MSIAAFAWVALAFAAGLGLGLFLRRQAALTASLEARLAAGSELAAREEQLRGREEQLQLLRASLAEAERLQRASQERMEALATSLARTEVSREASARRYEEAARELDALDAAADAGLVELERLRVDNARLGSQLEAEHQAQGLTHRLLDEQSALLLEHGKGSLEGLLSPLRERLKAFEEKVEKTYDQDNRDRASLLSHLAALQDSQAKLHHDAENLSRALRGQSRARGSWGELVLERLLETAGLTEGLDYRLQVNHLDEQGGTRRPDAVVYLPGNRAVVIDSKCPLAAFVEASAAQTQEARDALLDAHAAAVRTQLSALADKRYQDVVEGRTLDFVMMFIPNEAAFLAALAHRPGLFEEALRQRVHLCSPTTLLVALQLIAQVWRTEKQSLHARQIADEAGRLLDKLAAFEADLENVGRRLGLAAESWEDAKKKLLTGRGSVRRHAAKMVDLGARLPQGERALGAGLAGSAVEEAEQLDDEEDDGEPQRQPGAALGVDLPVKAPSA